MNTMTRSTIINRRRYANQFFAALSATLYVVAENTAITWYFGKLVERHSPVKIKFEEMDSLIYIIFIVDIVAPIPAAWMMDRFGRKTTLLLGSIPLSLGWILIGAAKSVTALQASHTFSSVANGIALVVTPIYLGEISSDRIRGSICSLTMIMNNFGRLYVSVIGQFVSITTVAWLALIPVLLFLLTFPWQPESPYYCLGKNRKTDALSSLKKLHGCQNAIHQLRQMEESVLSSEKNGGAFKAIYYTKGNRKAMIIIIGIAAVMVISGASFPYGRDSIQEIESNLTDTVQHNLFTAVRITSSLLSAATVDVLGRRSLLIFSLTGITISNGMMATYFSYEENEINVSKLAWLPTLATAALLFCSTVGHSVTYVLLGEIFPKNLKAIAGAIYGVTVATVNLANLELFPLAIESLDPDNTVIALALVAFCGIPFVWFLVPETKGKSLDSILMEMNGMNMALQWIP